MEQLQKINSNFYREIRIPKFKILVLIFGFLRKKVDKINKIAVLPLEILKFVTFFQGCWLKSKKNTVTGGLAVTVSNDYVRLQYNQKKYRLRLQITVTVTANFSILFWILFWHLNAKFCILVIVFGDFSAVNIGYGLRLRLWLTSLVLVLLVIWYWEMETETGR